ncbi:OmpA family protein [Dyadobacter fermentans]|uniref:OmpA family protein n=1 Tax=Dyadobacter fermentans TaxID=94254 RepID=UPI0003268CAB|nr:OmpA family protein [Dyadobacter fermentans]
MINILNTIAFLPIYFLCICQSAKCQNITGRWFGRITIPGYNGNEYHLEVSITQKDSLVSGQTKTIYEGKYAIMKLQGIVSKNKIVFTENEVIEDSSPNKAWCLKSFNGEYYIDTINNMKKIIGTYTGYTNFLHNRYSNEYCVPGSFILLQKTSTLIKDDEIFEDSILSIKKEEPLSLYGSKYGISYLISISLQFEQSTTNLSKSSTKNLSKILNCLSENRSVKITLESHTDNVGDLKKNLRLAEERAARIRQYLVDNKISESRIQCRILGPLLPLAPNNNEYNRSLNRRIVVKVQGL